MHLVIVESPAKAKSINAYLGPQYKVLASYGHVRDLPPKDGSVEPDDDFRMHWKVSSDKTRQLQAIVAEAQKADELILATDPDREGEAISWHIQEYLKARRALPAKVQRVTFNAITKDVVTKAMAHPRTLDQALIDAYLARRALDYLVGFTLSPVLWRKLPGARSAGRVQSVALRLIVEREREIARFQSRDYWTIDANMKNAEGKAFLARLSVWKGDKLGKFTLSDAASAEQARTDVAAGRFKVTNLETKDQARHPAPPFTTSTLQQEAARKLRMTATQTMQVAQKLYEAGRITYMRTDSVSLTPQATSDIRDVIAARFGSKHLPAKPRHYRTKAKNAQEAHEAIRATQADLSPEQARLSGDEARLYELIWQRTIASQMQSAQFQRTQVTLGNEQETIALRANGQVLTFPGFLDIYRESHDDMAQDNDDDGQNLPALKQGENVTLLDVKSEQHTTQPPPRYSEAGLVKKLEELGIGRPSTYASILHTLRERSYVRVDKTRFVPEESGELVTAFLEHFFERYVSYDFTADLEEKLDHVSAGDIAWKALLRDFWTDFAQKTAQIMERKPSEITQALDGFLNDTLFPPNPDGSDPRACPLCKDGRLALRGGRYGAFIACSNYPECRFTRAFGTEGGSNKDNSGPKMLGTDPETGEDITLRHGRYGAYIQRGEGSDSSRSSIPRDMSADMIDLEQALALLALPREVGIHPETGKAILAGLGRYGPYLSHDGAYARLDSSEELFGIGMNAAVVKLATARAGKKRTAEAIRDMGAHPTNGRNMQIMAGRYGPYVTDGETNASLPKNADPAALTLEEAAALIDARAAKGGSKKKTVKKKVTKKAPAKSAPKSTAAKTKAAPKKTAPKKTTKTTK